MDICCTQSYCGEWFKCQHVLYSFLRAKKLRCIWQTALSLQWVNWRWTTAKVWGLFTVNWLQDAGGWQIHRLSVILLRWTYFGIIIVECSFECCLSSSSTAANWTYFYFSLLSTRKYSKVISKTKYVSQRIYWAHGQRVLVLFFVFLSFQCETYSHVFTNV